MGIEKNQFRLERVGGRLHTIGVPSVLKCTVRISAQLVGDSGMNWDGCSENEVNKRFRKKNNIQERNI